jgi:hypothetical protein
MNKKAQDDVLEEIDDDELDEQEEPSKTKEQELVPVDEKPEQDDDDEDRRLAPDNEDREDLRRRRREEKVDRAQRRKLAIERDKAELQHLKQQNEELLRRVQGIEHKNATSEYVSLDQQIKAAQEESRAVEHIIARAVEAGNGDDVAKAMRIRDETKDKLRQLEYTKNNFKNPTTQPVQNTQPQALATQLAQDWMKMNSWYKPNSGDEKSDKVLKIDQGMANEGYNPNTLEYWRELDKRVEALNDDNSQRSGKRGPPLGSSREHAPRSTRNEVYVSPERKQAMIDAGVWDDPTARQRYLKQYAKWDKENSTR